MRDSVKVRREAITAFEAALGRFAAASIERDKAVDTALRRATAVLEERRIALRRRLARLRDEIENADEEHNTRRARRDYQESEEALMKAVKWKGRVEESANFYLRKAMKLQELNTEMTGKARSFLLRTLERLDAYFKFQYKGVTGARVSGTDTADESEIVDGPAPIRMIAKSLAAIPALQREAWDSPVTPDSRLEALQEAENRIAGAVGRPALPVLPAKLDPNMFGQCDGGTIWVNDDYLEPGFSHEMITTLVHEGRHAYQYYAVGRPSVHGDAAEVEAWRGNLSPGNYKEWIDDPMMYRTQPVEADAFAYESRVMEAYFYEGGN